MGGVGGAGVGVNGSNIMSDDLTWIKGNHSFRFGWEGRWYYYNEGGLQDTGSYTSATRTLLCPGTGLAPASPTLRSCLVRCATRAMAFRL